MIKVILIPIVLLISLLLLLVIAIIKRKRKFFLLALINSLLLIISGVYTTYLVITKGSSKLYTLSKNSIEHIFPTFNSDTPDTDANKRNFKEFLNIEITPDIKNIYCFDDALGQDADYMFSFNCNKTTAQKIITQNNLEKDSIVKNNLESLQHDFFWWNKKRIQQLPHYSWKSTNKGKKTHKTFWFDVENEKGYYFEYEL